MQRKLFFRVPASGHQRLAHEYFNVALADGEHWGVFNMTNEQVFEMTLYSFTCSLWIYKGSHNHYDAYLKIDDDKKRNHKKQVFLILKMVANAIRRAQQDYYDGYHDLANDQFKTIQLYLARANELTLGMVAGKAMLKAQRTRFNNKRNATKTRKKITKDEILKFMKDFEEKSALAGNINPLRGCKEAACLEFNVSLKTLNKRLKD